MISLLYVHKIFPFHQADACVSEYTGFISTNQIILNSVNVYWNYRAGARHWANPGGCRDGAWGPRLPANEPGALPPPRGLAWARHPARVRSRLPAARPVVGSREAIACFVWSWCLRGWRPWPRRDPVSHRRRSYPGSRRRQVFSFFQSVLVSAKLWPTWPKTPGSLPALWLLLPSPWEFGGAWTPIGIRSDSREGKIILITRRTALFLPDLGFGQTFL